MSMMIPKLKIKHVCNGSPANIVPIGTILDLQEAYGISNLKFKVESYGESRELSNADFKERYGMDIPYANKLAFEIELIGELVLPAGSISDLEKLLGL